MTWLIIAGFVVYAMIGFFFNGFFDITIRVDGAMFFFYGAIMAFIYIGNGNRCYRSDSDSSR